MKSFNVDAGLLFQCPSVTVIHLLNLQVPGHDSIILRDFALLTACQSYLLPLTDIPPSRTHSG